MKQHSPSNQERLLDEPRQSVLTRLRSRFAVVPAEVSLSDELIQERRATDVQGSKFKGGDKCERQEKP
jgi:hypothetical protein